jgi:hypothetical protein
VDGGIIGATVDARIFNCISAGNSFRNAVSYRCQLGVRSSESFPEYPRITQHHNILTGTGSEIVIREEGSPSGLPDREFTAAQIASGAYQSATGQGQGTLVSDPQFVDPSAAVLNFHLRRTSPAVDSADAVAAPVADFLNRPRLDAPGAANTGIGVPGFADRGAYEWTPPAMRLEQSSAGHVRLVWPPWAGHWVPEGSTGLSGSLWVRITSPAPAVNNLTGEMEITVPVVGSRGFLRLVEP